MNGYDEQAREDYKKNPGSVFAWILMASHIYYQKPDWHPLLSDEVFDKMCKLALDKYDTLHHDHAKQYITKDDLRAGSLYALPSYQYPIWAVRISEDLSRKLSEAL